MILTMMHADDEENDGDGDDDNDGNHENDGDDIGDVVDDDKMMIRIWYVIMSMLTGMMMV